jgi:hypothetical protein
MSSILEISLPTVEPVDPVAELTQFLKQPAGSPDAALIKTLGIAARRQLEDMLGLTLANRNFVQYEDGFPFFPYFQSPYAPLFGAAFPFYFGYGPIASYPYPAIGGLQNQMISPFEKRLMRSPVTAVQKILYVGTDGGTHQLTAGVDFVADYASQPGRLTPLPGQRWPVGILGINTVQIFFSAGYQATSQQFVIEPAIWEEELQVPQYGYIIDANDNVWVQTTAGTQTTGTARPDFEAGAVGAVIAGDGGCSWTNYGPVVGPWVAGQALQQPMIIFDGNNNLQLLNVADITTGATAPAWATARGVTTSDNSFAGAWLCLGPNQPGAQNPSDEITSYTGDIGIPEQFKIAIMILASHWYYNREPVTPGQAGTVPFSVEAIVQTNRVYDFGPIPS